MVNGGQTSPWLMNAGGRWRAALQLFCFPYAGGGSAIFHSWAHALTEEVLLCPIQLPGREGRLNEPSLVSLSQLVGEIAEALLPNFREPFALFGHSLGALVSFELARLLQRKYEIEPTCLFVSGCRAPQLSSGQGPLTFNLPEPEFVEELRRFNGTPEAVLAEPELMSLILPTLRADFEMAETYRYSQGEPLRCPIRTYGGLEDPKVSLEDLEAWRHQSAASFSLKIFPGDHFFIYSARSSFLAELSRDLRPLLRCSFDAG